SNTNPAGNVLLWHTTDVGIVGDSNGAAFANSSSYGVGTGRAVLFLQGGATGNDCIIAFQNTTGFVGGLIYSSNTELRLQGTAGNTSIWGAGIRTVNVSASQVNVAGSLNVTANISNTGNLLVTQNTFTGNLSVTTLANIATANITGTISAIG